MAINDSYKLSFWYTYTGFENYTIDVFNFHLYLMDLQCKHSVANIGDTRTNLLIPINGNEELSYDDIITVLHSFIHRKYYRP